MSRDVKINDVEQEQTGEEPMRIIPTQTESPPPKNGPNDGASLPLSCHDQTVWCTV